MRPDDETPDAPDDGETPGTPRPEDAPLSPATWAGRQRAGGEQPAPPAGDAAAEEPGELEDAEEPGSEPEALESEPRELEGDEPAQPEEEPEQVAGEEEAEQLEAEAEELHVEAEEQAGPELGDTVEAETLSLADREQAREAALAGLRARTGQHRAQPDASEPPAAQEPDSAEHEAEPTPEPVAVAAAVADDDGKAPRAKRVWPRFLAASFVIIASMAAATAVSVLVVLTDIARGLGGIAGVSERLDAVEGGDPQTILILGSDRRPTDDTGRSDTTILLRINPDTESLNLLSIPRDLRVNIPGYGIDKFNAAYSFGGPALTLETVKKLTGLSINHVVNVNFTGFADAVNAIGCVFIDIDRRYFVPEGSGYSAIDPPIEPGYQKVCGLKALQYVRFRYDDTDLVRAARQQDFVREARQKISPARLAFEPDYRGDLLDVFKEHTTSDDKLKNPIAVLELMKTFIAARKAGLNEVHFPAELGDADAIYVTADDDDIEQTIVQFLGTGGTPGPQEGGDDKPQRDSGADDKPKPDKPKPDRPKPEPEPEPQPDGPAMIDVTAMAQDYAAQIASSKRKNGKPFVRFPIFYPTRLTEGSTIDSTSRAFVVDGPTKYFGYKFVVPLQRSTTAYTEYYGVSGTNWDDPPILENPSETRTIDGREYLLFYDGDRLRLVGFKRDRKSYWVHNSLLQTLTAEEMISVATSLRERDG